MQLHGEYQHRLDPQGRIALPARYRDAFKAGAYLTQGFDPCVWVFTSDDWDSYSAKYNVMSPNSRAARVLRRRVFGRTFQVEIDRQGRVLVPSTLRQYADLQDEVVIIGAGSWLEMWDRQRWEQELAEIEAAGLDMSESGEVQG